MAEELGFRTPAKEVEELRKRIAQMEDVRAVAEDGLKLSLLALLRVFWGEAIANPKDARRIKDELLNTITKWEITPAILDALDDGFKAVCDKLGR